MGASGPGTLIAMTTERRTKIIASIGPASESPEMLRAMIDAGMDVARISLAHGSLEEGLELQRHVRDAAADLGRRIGVLVDLPGPKVRVAPFPDGGAQLVGGAAVELRPGNGQSSAELIEVDYDPILAEVRAGDRLAFGDGDIVVEALEVDSARIAARVLHGGTLGGRPGVHIPSDRLTLSAPTDDDLVKLRAFVETGVDMVAISFVRSGDDIRRVGTEPHPAGPLIVAKIETRAAIENLAGIIDASGAIMVARGDLGTECAIEDLPHLQKHIIRESIASGLPVITATQMLESMIRSPLPTRAEASDVANAIFDGSSAIMLSGETAVGDHPVLAIETMSRIAQRADAEFDDEGWARQLTELRVTASSHAGSSVTDAMTMAASRAVAQLGIDTIICISGSGFTVRSMARFRPQSQILGFSHNERTVQQLTLSWGVTPLLLEHDGSYEERVNATIAQARAAGLVHEGEQVAVLAGITGRLMPCGSSTSETSPHASSYRESSTSGLRRRRFSIHENTCGHAALRGRPALAAPADVGPRTPTPVPGRT